MKPREFIDYFSAAVIKSTKGTNIFPSVKMAQLAVETGWGKSTMEDANNVFGIKGNVGWSGKVISKGTREVLGGVSKNFVGTGKIYSSRTEAIKSGAEPQTLFRVYDSLADSIADHTRFLIVNPGYSKALQANTPEEQARELQAAKYATGENYANTLISIIEKNNLKELDKKKSL